MPGSKTDGAVTCIEACTRLALSVMGGRGTQGGTPLTAKPLAVDRFWEMGSHYLHHVSAAEPARFQWIAHTDSLG